MNDLRRRSVNLNNGFFSKIKEYDAYAKPLKDFRIQTSNGANITIISTLLILFLVWSEFVDFIRVENHTSISVDRSRKEKLEINMNITFPSLPCFMLSIDLMDIAGEHQNSADHSMHKLRLGVDGVILEKQKLNSTSGAIGAKNDTTAPGYCGSCYGALNPKSECCNTCESVRQQYREMGWSLEKTKDFEQCLHEGFAEQLKTQSSEGCRLEGFVKVSKVQGNFHFAPGASFEIQGMHAHDLRDYREHSKDWYIMTQFRKFSHEIHHLSFGDTRGLRNPLDEVIKKADGRFLTLTSVVSTQFVYLNGTTINSNQFSSTEHARDVSPVYGSMPVGMPGTFFSYDISPMLIEYREYRKPWMHFLTDLCAIIGGVFTVAGMIDSVVYSAEQKLFVKTELGKQT